MNGTIPSIPKGLDWPTRAIWNAILEQLQNRLPVFQEFRDLQPAWAWPRLSWANSSRCPRPIWPWSGGPSVQGRLDQSAGLSEPKASECQVEHWTKSEKSSSQGGDAFRNGGQIVRTGHSYGNLRAVSGAGKQVPDETLVPLKPLKLLLLHSSEFYPTVPYSHMETVSQPLPYCFFHHHLNKPVEHFYFSTANQLRPWNVFLPFPLLSCAHPPHLLPDSHSYCHSLIHSPLDG